MKNNKIKVVIVNIKNTRQCFRYDNLYVPGTCHSLLVFHFYVKIVYVVLCKKNTIQKIEQIQE